ncbi:methylglyoxal synthase [Paracoccus sp. Z330]|uniref:Methylglyoxal synthase n=1 Tax=Paracoccus onchidii TaxID=3017813 RepID=A0ABT4ZA29_9RHOB|nr:methylglyoxal synthase [Paracoccus onchidii]MDB6176212.1 methylglyoxal synthase [Paracoccus onchidii]
MTHDQDDPRKTIALIAHDHKKAELASWVQRHAGTLDRHRLVSTETTGGVISASVSLENLTRVKSGPLGGDQQIGAMIALNQIDLLVFFTDPMTPHPHDVDVKALTRLAIVYDIPMACSVATADLIMAAGFL